MYKNMSTAAFMYRTLEYCRLNVRNTWVLQSSCTEHLSTAVSMSTAAFMYGTTMDTGTLSFNKLNWQCMYVRKYVFILIISVHIDLFSLTPQSLLSCLVNESHLMARNALMAWFRRSSKSLTGSSGCGEEGERCIQIKDLIRNFTCIVM